jgi:hypothetical protein
MSYCAARPPYGVSFNSSSIAVKPARSPVTIVLVADPREPQAAPRSKRRVLLVVVAVLAILTAGIWAAGGLRAQPSGPESGLDARAGNMKLHEFDPAANILVVRMRVTDLGKESYGIGSFVHGIVAEPHPGKYAEADLMRSEGDIDGQETSTIHPRLPVTVQVVWVLGNAAAPTKITVALRTWEYGQSFTTDTIYWSVTKQSPIKAEISVPVRQGATS